MKTFLIIFTLLLTINTNAFEKENQKIALNQQEYIEALENRIKNLPLEKQSLAQEKINRLKTFSEEEFSRHKERKIKNINKLNPENKRKLKRKMFCHKIKELDNNLLKEGSSLQEYKNYISNDSFVQRMPEKRKNRIIRDAERFYSANEERKEEIKRRINSRYNKICNGKKRKSHNKQVKNFE